MELKDALFKVLEERHSVRDYLDKPVSFDDIGLILEAGRLAPSSGNLQPYFFILVKDQEKKEKIAEACLEQWWMAKAAWHIVLVGDCDKCKKFYGIRGESLYCIQNVAMAAENMLLCAQSLNLGACFVAAFDELKIARLLDIPEGYRAQGIITIGYERSSERKPKAQLDKLVYFESFGNRLEDVDLVLKNINVVGRTINGSKKISKKLMDRIKEAVKKIDLKGIKPKK
ncbi:MAG: hypothetical protein PWR32_195 [Candidatus Woesearchaeota archaeon]|nr:hypothetical protein [Candidatus Woesearchaeota archaeon]